MTDLRWVSDGQGYVYYSLFRETDTIIPEGMSTLLEMLKTALDEYNMNHIIRYYNNRVTFTINTFEIILSQTTIYLNVDARAIASVLLESIDTELITQLMKMIRVYTFANKLRTTEYDLYTISRIHDLLESQSYIGRYQ